MLRYVGSTNNVDCSIKSSNKIRAVVYVQPRFKDPFSKEIEQFLTN